MSTPTSVPNEAKTDAPVQPSVADLVSLQKSQADMLAKLEAMESAAKASAQKNRSEGPFARTGESALTSRGFSYMKLFGALSGQVARENAKVEIDLSHRLKSIYADQMGYIKEPNSIMAPFASALLSEIPGQEGFAGEVCEVVKAGIGSYDPDELRYVRRNMQTGGYSKALSWLDETTGGSLVAPPLMGELIELLRNNEVFMQAGARVIPLPPNGRVVYPRQTTAGSAYWVGESQSITDSTPGTGDVILQAKKLAILNKIPNELFRFSSVSIEMFLREDISRVMALKLDKALLEGAGTQYEPKGLINYSGITSHDASTTGSDGNTFTPEDVLKMVGKVEEKNAYFKSFVMRPLMYAAMANRRADAVSASDGKGAFIFNMFRELNTNIDVTRLSPGTLYQYPVFKSTQISNTRTKGSGTALSYILGGDFTDYLIAMSGALEFMVSTQGDSPFTTDQTWIRGITLCDGAPRHEASFILCDSLVVG